MVVGEERGKEKKRRINSKLNNAIINGKLIFSPHCSFNKHVEYCHGLSTLIEALRPLIPINSHNNSIG